MSITIKSTFGDPCGGNGRAFSRACLDRSPQATDPARIAMIALAAGTLTWAKRRKLGLARSSFGTSSAAIPSAKTNHAKL